MRLSTPAERMRESYDVVVVGSGYGGAIVANRLTRAGARVALLERGREWHTGQFPNTLFEAAREFHVDTPGVALGGQSDLYRLHVGEDINVFSHDHVILIVRRSGPRSDQSRGHGNPGPGQGRGDPAA